MQTRNATGGTRLPEAPYPEAPDLDALLNTFGSWSAIPHDAWEAFDLAVEEWHGARRIHTAGCVLYPVPDAKRKVTYV